jgi:hypothetical protein
MESPNAPRNPEIYLVALGLAANTLWEFAHSSYYTDHTSNLGYLFRTRIHCAVSDVMILLCAFWITCLATNSRQWFNNPSAWPATLFIATGLNYTIWSEWYHTTIAHTWTYTRSMPILMGIGVTPIIQWLTIPTLLVMCLKGIGIYCARRR